LAAQQQEPQAEEVISKKDQPIAAGSTHAPSRETVSRRDDQITEELKQIRAQLARIEKRLADTIPVKDSAQLNVSGRYALGQKDASVTLAEFGDYQCPYCRRFYTDIFQKLRKNYIETGKVRFVALNLPLEMHPNAFHAAEAVLCAGEQSKFWEMHELLLTRSKDLGADAILRDAEQLRLNKASFQSCLESGRLAAKVKEDVARAQDLGISGTPTFILGRSRNGEVAGVKLVGVQSYEGFAARIQGLLDRKPQKRE
jgi:protein-disulfide isomerase